MKVLVGCPTYEGKAYMLEKYAESVKNLDYESYDILLVDNSESEEYMERIKRLGLPIIKGPRLESKKASVIGCRNLLREHALANGYDYFFSLEQDVAVEPDTLKRLLAHQKEYVTTVVLNIKVIKGKLLSVPMLSVPWEEHPGKLRYVRMADLQKGPLIEIAQAHLACTLLSREVLEKFPFRFEDGAFDDTCLTEDMRKEGYTLYCDTTLRPRHRPSPGGFTQ